MAIKQDKITAQNINKSFGSNQVLKGISFTVKEGESFVIIGGSGTGKSVLIKTIIGLVTPDKGSKITIEGKDTTFLDMSERSELIKKFGVLFQGGALFDSLPVWANITFGLRQNSNVSKQNVYRLAVKKLEMVGLKPSVADLFPSELSGGMIKRVALARAIAADPEIIFFDEPTAGLDPIMSGVISELIKKCSKELGATTITITHDMHCAQIIADKVAMIHEGNLVWHGDGSQIMKSGNEHVDQFVNGKASGPIKI